MAARRRVDDLDDTKQELVHVVRLALSNQLDDLGAYVRRIAHRYRQKNPLLAAQLDALLKSAAFESSPLRKTVAEPVPVDNDSRLDLAKVENPVRLEEKPIWAPRVAQQLQQLVRERERRQQLVKANLLPSKTALFIGAPGVGKTLAARWLAEALRRPLVTLDLASVMSSFLGRSGNNIRHVLDYAKANPSVLLLDEFDAIAKRRDDQTEIGELKRLVTVLLQEIDQWPTDGFLIAATNHGELLDPAVWRRFDIILEFPKPTIEQVQRLIKTSLGDSVSATLVSALTGMLNGLSYAEVKREILTLRRRSVLEEKPIVTFIDELIEVRSGNLTRPQRIDLAVSLLESGLSQRAVQQATGVSRDTLRGRMSNKRTINGRATKVSTR